MGLKVVLFDLDGTLLPMEQDKFVKTYFDGIAKSLAVHGYDPKKLINSIWLGTKAMIKNNGEETNEKVFWKTFADIYGENVYSDEPYFDAFYREKFDEVQRACGYNTKAAETIMLVKSLGLRTALATNPIFPAIATQKRIKWAGLSETDFELYTTYENARYSKPNLNYYLGITKELGVAPQECLMVGNDVDEDMIAEKLGMKVFLLTDCIINKDDKDISVYPHGDFDDLVRYIETQL